ncbi:MAG TPA: glycosyltransferase [Candidatus Binatia bacterium]|nr:glycosyltransferase [Candidatus Binatia bacterium]
MADGSEAAGTKAVPRPLDVLVVGWYPALGDPGAGRFIADQVAAIRATGRVQPWVATFEAIPLFGTDRLRSAAERAAEHHLTTAISNGPNPFLERGATCPAGIPVARLGFPAGPTRRTGSEHGLRHREAVLAALAERPDRPAWVLVHGHVGYPEGAAAARIARRLDVPFVLTEHATYLHRILSDRVQRSRYIEAVRQASRLVTVTRMLGEELIAELGREIPDLPERLVVVPNAIAVDDFPVVGPEERAPAELLWVGYRKPIKGIETLLRAFARVRQVHPEARLRMIGASVEPTADEHWRSLAGSLGVADAVSIEGPTDRSGIAQAMARATLFVHPSHRETFGVVAAEALATGLPVVATDSGGVTEVLGPHPDRFGALVPPGDPEALAAAILVTLERRRGFDPWELRRWVEERYGARVVADSVVHLYEAVLTERRSPSGRRPIGRGGAPQALPARRSVMTHRIVVVGFQRSLLDRQLAKLPADLLGETIIVSTGTIGPGSGRWVLSPEGADARLTALLARGWRPPPAASLGDRLRRWVRIGLRRLRLAGHRLREAFTGVDSESLLIGELRQVLDTAIAETMASGTDHASDAFGGLPRRVSGAAGLHNSKPLLVCLAGVDHLVAAPLVAKGIAVAPGGLAWLADHLALAGEPTDRT